MREGIGMAETVVQGFTQHELEVLREISLHKRQMDYQEDLIEMQQEARDKGRIEGRAEGRIEGQRQLLDLLESGKSLEEARRILGLA
jgi:predicted transposase YdaD